MNTEILSVVRTGAGVLLGVWRIDPPRFDTGRP